MANDEILRFTLHPLEPERRERQMGETMEDWIVSCIETYMQYREDWDDERYDHIFPGSLLSACSEWLDGERNPSQAVPLLLMIGLMAQVDCLFGSYVFYRVADARLIPGIKIDNRLTHVNMFSKIV